MSCPTGIPSCEAPKLIKGQRTESSADAPRGSGTAPMLRSGEVSSRRNCPDEMGKDQTHRHAGKGLAR